LWSQAVAVVAFAWASCVSAGPPLSLNEALAMAREKNPVLRAARQAALSAAEDVKAARADFMPRVGFFAGYVSTDEPVTAFGMKLNQGIIAPADFEPVRLNDPDPIDNLHFGFRFEQPLFKGGRIRWNHKASELGREAAARNEEHTGNAILFQVVRAYLAALQARSEVKLLKDSVALSGALRDKIKNMSEQGMVTRADLLAAEVRLRTLEQDLLTARKAASLADTELAAAVGAGIGKSYELTETLGEPAGESESLDKWIETAYSNRADLKSMELGLDQGRAYLRVARGAFLPEAALSGAYEWNDGDFFADPHGGYTVGFEVGFTIFDGGSRAARMHKSRFNVARMEALVESLRLNIRVDVENSLNELETARSYFQIAGEAVAQSEEALRIISDRYEAGLSDRVELLGAEVDLTNSRVRRDKALYQYHLARAMLRQASGLAPE
jgi:outer membrane protein TolC